MDLNGVAVQKYVQDLGPDDILSNTASFWVSV